MDSCGPNFNPQLLADTHQCLLGCSLPTGDRNFLGDVLLVVRESEKTSRRARDSSDTLSSNIKVGLLLTHSPLDFKTVCPRELVGQTMLISDRLFWTLARRVGTSGVKYYRKIRIVQHYWAWRNVDRSQGKAGKFKEKKGTPVTHKIKGRVPRARTKARVSLSNHSNLCNTSSTTSLSSKVIVASAEHEGHRRADCYSGKEDAKLHQSLTSQRVAHPQAFQSQLALWHRWIVIKQR